MLTLAESSRDVSIAAPAIAEKRDRMVYPPPQRCRSTSSRLDPGADNLFRAPLSQDIRTSTTHLSGVSIARSQLQGAQTPQP